MLPYRYSIMKKLHSDTTINSDNIIVADLEIFCNSVWEVF